MNTDGKSLGENFETLRFSGIHNLYQCLQHSAMITKSYNVTQSDRINTGRFQPGFVTPRMEPEPLRNIDGRDNIAATASRTVQMRSHQGPDISTEKISEEGSVREHRAVKSTIATNSGAGISEYEPRTAHGEKIASQINYQLDAINVIPHQPRDKIRIKRKEKEVPPELLRRPEACLGLQPDFDITVNDDTLQGLIEQMAELNSPKYDDTRKAWPPREEAFEAQKGPKNLCMLPYKRQHGSPIPGKLSVHGARETVFLSTSEHFRDNKGGGKESSGVADVAKYEVEHALGFKGGEGGNFSNASTWRKAAADSGGVGQNKDFEELYTKLALLAMKPPQHRKDEADAYSADKKEFSIKMRKQPPIIVEQETTRIMLPKNLGFGEISMQKLDFDETSLRAAHKRPQSRDMEVQASPNDAPPREKSKAEASNITPKKSEGYLNVQRLIKTPSCEYSEVIIDSDVSIISSILQHDETDSSADSSSSSESVAESTALEKMSNLKERNEIQPNISSNAMIPIQLAGDMSNRGNPVGDEAWQSAAPQATLIEIPGYVASGVPPNFMVSPFLYVPSGFPTFPMEFASNHCISPAGSLETCAEHSNTNAANDLNIKQPDDMANETNLDVSSVEAPSEIIDNEAYLTRFGAHLPSVRGAKRRSFVASFRRGLCRDFLNRERENEIGHKSSASSKRFSEDEVISTLPKKTIKGSLPTRSLNSIFSVRGRSSTISGLLSYTGNTGRKNKHLWDDAISSEYLLEKNHALEKMHELQKPQVGNNFFVGLLRTNMKISPETRPTHDKESFPFDSKHKMAPPEHEAPKPKGMAISVDETLGSSFEECSLPKNNGNFPNILTNSCLVEQNFLSKSPSPSQIQRNAMEGTLVKASLCRINESRDSLNSQNIDSLNLKSNGSKLIPAETSLQYENEANLPEDRKDIQSKSEKKTAFLRKRSGRGGGNYSKFRGPHKYDPPSHITNTNVCSDKKIWNNCLTIPNKRSNSKEQQQPLKKPLGRFAIIHEKQSNLNDNLKKTPFLTGKARKGDASYWRLRPSSFSAEDARPNINNISSNHTFSSATGEKHTLPASAKDSKKVTCENALSFNEGTGDTVIEPVYSNSGNHGQSDTAACGGSGKIRRKVHVHQNDDTDQAEDATVKNSNTSCRNRRFICYPGYLNTEGLDDLLNVLPFQNLRCP